ncbi:hypothetical protein OIV83_001394 [Microbotryomycetes sp. JL201]|nr:hypothetical protein OIV83_001394 [Microbotryomycetes sp. JL201]
MSHSIGFQGSSSSQRLRTARQPQPPFRPLIDLNVPSTFHAPELESKDLQRPYSSPRKKTLAGIVSGIEESVELKSKMPWSRRKVNVTEQTTGEHQKHRIVDFDELQARHRLKLKRRVGLFMAFSRCCTERLMNALGRCSMQQRAQESTTKAPDRASSDLNNMHIHAKVDSVTREPKQNWTSKLFGKSKPMKETESAHERPQKAVVEPVPKLKSENKSSWQTREKPFAHGKTINDSDDEDWNPRARGRRLKTRYPGHDGAVKFRNMGEDDEEDEDTALLGLWWLDYQI